MQIMQVTWMTSQQRIAGTDHSMFHSTRWTVRGKTLWERIENQYMPEPSALHQELSGCIYRVSYWCSEGNSNVHVHANYATLTSDA